MKADLLLLGERLVLAVETMSQDIKNMSAYVYDLGFCMSNFLNDKKGKVGVSVVTGSESSSVPCDLPANGEEAFTESEYSLQCEQTEGCSVPHTDVMEHEEMCVQDVRCMSYDQAEGSDVSASFTGGIKFEELSETVENGMAENTSDSGRNAVTFTGGIKIEELSETVEHGMAENTSDSGRNAVTDFVVDIKDDIDIHEDLFPLPEQTEVPVTIGAPKFEDSTNHMTRYPEDQDSIRKTQKVMSAYGLKGHSVHNNSDETDGADGKLLNGYMNDGEMPPQESCRAAGASSSCSKKKLREHDGKEKEDLREKGSGAGARHFKEQNKEKASARKSRSEQSGRQKRNRSPLRCDTCHRCFSFKCQLEKHKRVHTGEKPFCCAVCNKTFPFKHSLVRHFRLHYDATTYKCSTCDKSFTETDSLKRHMRLHSEEKPFGCRVCGKVFNQNGHLYAHMLIHMGKKPFICGECGKAFREKSTLTRHMRVHTGERPFSCKSCGESFAFSGSLKYHRCG